MGLDSVELVLEVENTFGFSIPDEVAESLSTVGKLYDYVLDHRIRGKQDACLSSITFHKIRRGLMSVLQIPRAAVRLSTELSSLIPKRRRRTWRALAKTTGLRLPMLRRPHWVVTLATLAAFALGFASTVVLTIKPFHGGIVVTILMAGVFGYALFWLTECLAIMFPPDVATVGQLAKATLARNYLPIVAESKKSSTDAEVWQILCRVIGEQLGVQPDRLTKETSFVEDLNIG